ncbi:RNase adapter RapZ [Agarilytica rhodophyticola]|uniref:RNase adapter RapZ n=1 Tax=Agarilytica rhodophyticola TaxID=1737490 RepID=UPI000B341BA1|nr:RNase adapter RapZ [Agarilytica rhodophyticola]
MSFLVISGRSGSGKTSALHLLEDEGFTCIDNIPVTLLPSLIEHINQQEKERFAIGIDARNLDKDLGTLSGILKSSQIPRENYKVIYLDTHTNVLIKRFSETRRRHPLSDENTGLNEALEKERDILAPIVGFADIIIDTSALNLHEMRSTMRQLIVGPQSKSMSIMFSSFGFKYGAPTDADFIFDVRSLPNPHWEPGLRLKTGLDVEVADYLSSQNSVEEMINDITGFVAKWIPSFENNNRSYLTVAIGCTGGMHRSVYISERLYQNLKETYKDVQVRHRQLQNNNLKNG